MSWEGNPPPDQQLAGWWQRVGATVLDGLIVGVPLGVLVSVAGASVALLLIFVVAQLAYVSLMLSNKGRTVGMMAVGTRCIDPRTGGNLTLQQALLRSVVASASNIGSVISSALGLVILLFTVLDVLWPLWDGRNQTLHDKVVGSLVVTQAKLVADPPFPGGTNWDSSSGGGWHQGPPGASPGAPAPGEWGRPPGSGWPAASQPSSGSPPSSGGWQASPPSPAPPAQTGWQDAPAAPTPAPAQTGWQDAPAAPTPAPARTGWQSPPPAPPVPPPVQSPPAAWYPDPAGSPQERWWDGRSWTDHLRNP